MRAVMVVNTGAPTTTVAEGVAGLGAGLVAGLVAGVGAAEVRRFLTRVLALTGAGFLVAREAPRAAVTLALVGLDLALTAGLGAEAEDLAAFLIFFMA